MEESLKPLGLQLAADGKISERPFLHTLRQTFVRDQRALKIFDVSRPAHPCFGIDHARISGARDFTQGGITLGACYKSGDLLSEQMHVTLCIGLHHDDGKGLSAMLGPKEASGDRPAVVGIGPEFVQLADSKELEMADGSCVPCEPVICLDLAAFRGITQKRGKCSAICACRGLKSLQSYPGNDGIPDLPTGRFDRRRFSCCSSHCSVSVRLRDTSLGATITYGGHSSFGTRRVLPVVRESPVRDRR